MATIPTLPRGISAYVAAFDLASIAVTSDGRLVVTRNPADTSSACWSGDGAVAAGNCRRHRRRWCDLAVE